MLSDIYLLFAKFRLKWFLNERACKTYMNNERAMFQITTVSKYELTDKMQYVDFLKCDITP